MPRLNVQQNNQNIIKAFQVALETGHRNLLDNPWFTVNQRNFTTSTGVNNFYSVDRWYIARGTGTISKTNNGITINGVGASRETTFQQMIDCGDLTGRTVTVSVNDGGTIRQITRIVPARTTSNNIFIRFTLRDGVSAFLYAMATSSAYAYMLQFQVNAGYTIDIRAVKLELGSYSTLANDVPQNDELECLKYQELIQNVAYNYIPIGFGAFAGGNTIRMFIPTSVPMNAASLHAFVPITGSASVAGNGTTTSVASITLVGVLRTGVYVNVNLNSATTTGHTYSLMLGDGASILIDCNL